MPRHAHLEAHLSHEELRQRYRAAKDPIELRRWQLIWLVSQKRTLKQASEVVGLNYDYAREVLKAYNQGGVEALRNRQQERRAPTPKRLLSAAQEAELKEALKQAPDDEGKWTSRKVAQWISEKLSRKVRPQRGWDYLKRLGYVRRKPRPRHVKADAEAQETFKKR